MKSILIILWTILFTIIAIPAMIKMKILYKNHPEKAEATAKRWMSLYMNGDMFISGSKLTVIGEENIPEDAAALFVGNHRSFFDVVITYPRLKNMTTFIAKVDLKKIPTFGYWGKNMQVLFFDRSNIKESMKMILESINRVKEGNSVCIFPEGTRNKNSEIIPLGEFHDGSFKIAVKTGCPIVPMALIGTDNIWEAHFPWIKKAEVKLIYGKPVYINDLDPEQKKHPGEYFKGVIEDMIRTELCIPADTKADDTAAEAEETPEN